MTVIAGNAFPDTHPEIEKAMSDGIPVIRYHKFLGDYMKNSPVLLLQAHTAKRQLRVCWLT